MSRDTVVGMAAGVVAVCGVLLPLRAELVAHWRFDEAAGTVIADSSGFGNDGTLMNPRAGTWTGGVRGTGLYFPGVTGSGATYVEVADSASLDITDAISFAAWVRCDNIERDAPVLAKEAPGDWTYWFGAVGGPGAGAPKGNFGMLLSAGGGSWTLFDRDQEGLPEGTWVHLATTWDGTTSRYYLDGAALAETGTFSGPIHQSNVFIGIGVNSTYKSAAFEGAVDELMVFNHALSATDVAALAQPPPVTITAAEAEGADFRITWGCIPGRSYQVQMGSPVPAGGGIDFADFGAPIVVPVDHPLPTCDFLDPGVLPGTTPRFYRVALLP